MHTYSVTIRTSRTELDTVSVDAVCFSDAMQAAQGALYRNHGLRGTVVAVVRR